MLIICVFAFSLQIVVTRTATVTNILYSNAARSIPSVDGSLGYDEWADAYHNEIALGG